MANKDKMKIIEHPMGQPMYEIPSDVFRRLRKIAEDGPYSIEMIDDGRVIRIGGPGGVMFFYG